MLPSSKLSRNSYLFNSVIKNTTASSHGKFKYKVTELNFTGKQVQDILLQILVSCSMTCLPVHNLNYLNSKYFLREISTE